jgi:hypothetical protein
LLSVILLGFALIYFVIRHERLTERFLSRLEHEDERAYEMGRLGIEGELRALREGFERERNLISESNEREHALFDRILDKKNVAPLGEIPREPPPPLKSNWNEQDHTLYRSWSDEEKFIQAQQGAPEPPEQQLERIFRMNFGTARPSEVL